jgi:phage terminase large subunit
MSDIVLAVSNSFFPLLEDKSRYLVLCGGAGSGKSEFAARKLYYRSKKEGGHRFLILRKVRSRVRESVLEVSKNLLDATGETYEFNKTERTIAFNAPNGKRNEWLFDGLDDPDKIKSIKGVTGIWMEETTEFTKDDFTQIDLRLREPGPSYHQIILSFNPDEAAAPWIKERFFDHKDSDALVHTSTVEDNPIAEIREAYRVRLDMLDDPTYSAIYRFGQWALAKGVIFNWEVVGRPEGIFWDEIFYGLDFGFSVDPAALARVYRKADEFWLEELLYARNLTNQELASVMKSKGINRTDEVYADSAEPKSIEELCRAGLNVKPCAKGADSVRAGIDYLKNLKIHILGDSPNLVDERRRYKYKTDKAGNSLAVPAELNDHLMSAVRYAIHTHCAGRIERHFHFI